MTDAHTPRTSRLSLCLAALPLLAAASAAQAATLTVTNLADSGPGSLRQAVLDAASGDVIEFGLAGDITLSAMIDLNKDLVIQNTLAGAVRIVAGVPTDSLFQVGLGRSAGLTGVSLLNAQNAVRNNGNLSLTRVLARGNTGSMGAAVTGCVVPSTQVLNVVDSVFIDNAAVNGGGAIAACGQINIVGSTFAGNSAVYGGALAVTNTGAVNIVNSTFSGNSALAFGGAIATNYPDLTLNQVTFAGNAAPDASSLWAGSVPVTVQNSVFASGGGGGAHCFATATAGAGNLNFADPGGFNSCGPTVEVTTDPLLGPLADNGGPTPTMALGVGSPAIDAGAAAGSPPVDQRGIARPQGAGVDIGAYERAAAGPGPGPGGVAAVPTLGGWGLIGLALAAALAGGRRLRRRL